MASPTVLSDFPQSWGNKRVSVWYHKGPVLYAPVVIATPVTTGDAVTDTESGLRYIEFLIGGISDNGQYLVTAIPSGGNPSQPQPNGGTVGSAQRTWRLMWSLAVSGQEAGAVDLSGRTVRLFAIGVK